MMDESLPILRYAVAHPLEGWSVTQPYFLADAAIDLLGIWEGGTRPWRVAKVHFKSALQVLYTGNPLGTKPERALSEEEVVLVEAQSRQAYDEWAAVTAYFEDEGPFFAPHSYAEIQQMLAVLVPAFSTEPPLRPSPLAR